MNNLENYDFSLGFNGNDWEFNDNPYYHPEKCGLKTIAEIELSEPSYSFDTRVVWKADNGKIYTAHDSGCSCPIPFEDYKKLSDLTLVDDSIMNAIKEELRKSDYTNMEEKQNFLYKIRDAVRESQ